MDEANRAKVSFKLRAKRKFTSQSPEPAQSPNHHLPQTHDKVEHLAADLGKGFEAFAQCFPSGSTSEFRGAAGTTAISQALTPQVQAPSGGHSSARVTLTRPIHRPLVNPNQSMAEPPAKRAKRTDSSAMWERNSSRATDTDRKYSSTKETRNGRDRRDDRDRDHRREDGRRRSRSRDRTDKRRDRSRSRERDGGRHRNGERGGEEDRRDRERTTSRERHRPRRGEQYRDSDECARRYTDLFKDATRHHTRSRSPPRKDKPPTRARSPPRDPLSKVTPATTQLLNPTTKPPPPKSLPPTEPRKPSRPNPERNPQTAMADSSPPATNGIKSPPTDSNPTTAMDVDSDPEIALMRKMMGFATFKTTKNTKVPGNNVYGVRKEKKTEYRQYMNRVGGFNRPLSPSR